MWPASPVSCHHSGGPSAGAHSALAGPAGGGPSEEGAGPAASLDGDAREEEEGGEGGAAERPPAALDEPAEEGGLQPAVPRAGEYASVPLMKWKYQCHRTTALYCSCVQMLKSVML